MGIKMSKSGQEGEGDGEKWSERYLYSFEQCLKVGDDYEVKVSKTHQRNIQKWTGLSTGNKMVYLARYYAGALCHPGPKERGRNSLF